MSNPKSYLQEDEMEIFSKVQLTKKKVFDLRLELSRLNLPQTGNCALINQKKQTI